MFIPNPCTDLKYAGSTLINWPHVHYQPILRYTNSYIYGTANIPKHHACNLALSKARNHHFPGCLAGAGHCVPTQQSITPLSHCPYELAALSTRLPRSQPVTGARAKAMKIDHAIYTCVPKVASYETNNVPLGYVYAAPAQGAKNGAAGPLGTSSSGL